MKILQKCEKIYRFFRRFAKGSNLDFEKVPDFRQEKKVKRPLKQILKTLFLGVLMNETTLRDVEKLEERLSNFGQSWLEGKVSDTTLDRVIREVDTAALHDQLFHQVCQMNRKKMLKPVDLPCGVVTVDGKNLATLDHDAGGLAQKRHREDGTPYWLAMAVRATLTSAVSKPCIAQMPIPVGTNDMGSCIPFVDMLHNLYGESELFKIMDFDAGFCSLENANEVNKLGYAYIFALKENQRDLLLEAQRLLLPLAEKELFEAETNWEYRNGNWIRRRLYRTNQMIDWETSAGRWDHLRQTWLVRQETRDANRVIISVEDRFFISSLLWNYLKPHQILTVVRGHWGIENDTFNSLDLQWREDSGAWATQGKAVWNLGIIRLMAYNIAQYLRKRHLVTKNNFGEIEKPLSWRSLFKAISDAFIKEFHWETEEKLNLKTII